MVTVAEGPREFGHIHCSSRFDRSAVSLEGDLDDWMKLADIITLTEVNKDQRASRAKEKGWSYFNAKKDHGQDECAVLWKDSEYVRKHAMIRKLNNERFYRLNGKPALPIFSASVVLRHAPSGHRLLVSVCHFPEFMEGQRYRTIDDHWKARRAAYLSALRNWASHVNALDERNKCDAVLVSADWNIDLKHEWFTDDLMKLFGDKKYNLAWTAGDSGFPTSGGSMPGGGQAPDGAPGKGDHDHILDGSLINGLAVIGGPHLMDRVRSSDHRPVRQTLRLVGKAAHPQMEHGAHPGGDQWRGPSWWGFGDYMDDELYMIHREFEDA